MDNFSVKRTTFNSPANLASRAYLAIQDRYLSLDLEWRKPLITFAVWRIGLLLLPFIAYLVVDSGKTAGTAPYKIDNFYQGTTNFWNDRLFTAWGRWDGEWYLQITNSGY